MDVRTMTRNGVEAAQPARNEDACLLLLDEALRSLEKIDARKHAIVEMRFFLGLSVEETAEALEISQEAASRELRLAQAWLRREVTQGSARIRSTTRSTS